MVIDARLRVLEKLSYRYYLKDNSRSSEENWERALQFLKKLEKRYKK